MKFVKKSREKKKAENEQAATEIKAALRAFAKKWGAKESKEELKEGQKKGEKVEEAKDKWGSQSNTKEEKRSLEEELRGEREEAFARGLRESPMAEYLRKRPVEELHQELEELHQATEERGYITREEERQVEYVLGALEQKWEDQDAGLYTFSEEAARTAGLVHQLGEHLRDLYRQEKREKRQGELYQQ